MSSLRASLATIIACMAISSMAYVHQANASARAVPRGGVLHTAFDADFASLDPSVAYDPFSWTGEHAIYDGLLDYSSGNGSAGTRLVPRLATALPTITDGGLLYTFTLRQGVRFQAPVNREVTSADVRYSIERALSPNTPGAAMNGSPFFSSLLGVGDFWNKKAQHIAGIALHGRYGISFQLTTPDRAFLNVLALPFTLVVPREWVKRWGSKFSDHALGTGPFVLQSWVHGSRMVLVRNPGYFRPGVPILDRVDIDFNVGDHLQIQRVEAGALDLGGNLVTAADYLSLKDDPRWSRYLVAVPDISVAYLAFNLTEPPFKGNLDLRRAINMATNKPFMLRLLNGRGVAMNGILPPTMPGADPHFSYYPYNPAMARALLRKAGYRPGQLALSLTYQQSGDFDKIAQEIQSELADIGVTVKLKPVSTNDWYGKIAYNKDREGPMVLAPWGQDYPDPSDFFDPILSCNGSSNAAFYCNPSVDALGNRARGNPDAASRYAQYRQMERMVMKDAPWAPLYDDILVDFHGPRLRGFYIHPVWPFSYAEYYLAT